ncbi:hypothetical protein FKW77_002277 [Venturia effusa]|uniref:Uncharacterized protein n=1 Tax=Venturia effusa TaxID=50376 RepID=A0A517LC19_9PEZI|nr:hypothetical protein FKW77_002277 [Venturia effusa]
MDAGFSTMNFTDGQGFDKWAHIVERYTRLDLSKVSDRLVAISGVAKAIKNQTQDEYFAGHWKSSFLHSLLWAAWQDPRGGSKVPGLQHLLPDCKPTASEEDPLFPGYHDMLCSIESVSIESIGNDADNILGIIAGGQLTLRSPLISKDTFEKLLDTLPGFPHVIYVGSEDITKAKAILSQVQWYWDTDSDQRPSNAFLAPILIVRRHDYGTNGETWHFSLSALILVPTDAEGTTYTREGLFTMNFTDAQIDKCKLALDGAGLEFWGDGGRAVRAKESSLERLVIV